LSAVLQNGPQAGLAWTDTSNNETSFVVERSDNGGVFAALATLPANTVSYADATVMAGNAYTYRVMAANAGGPSAYSNTASVTLTAPPAAPTALTATVLTNPTRVRLAWLDNATTETGFVIERSLNSGPFTLFTTVAARNGTGPVTFTGNNLVSGNAYSYRVAAINGAGSSAFTNVVTVTIGSIPAAPTNLADAMLGNPLRVRLTWRDNATNESNFILERSANGGAFTLLATVASRAGTGNVTYNDTTVLVGNTYDYRVKAINGVGSSAYSNTFTAAVVAPAAPSNFAGSAVVSGTNATVTLTWVDNSSNETSFEVQRATNAAFTAGVNTNTVAANSTTRVETRTRNRSYYYRIRAVNPAGVSAWVNMTPFPIVTP
jgi:titin